MSQTSKTNSIPLTKGPNYSTVDLECQQENKEEELPIEKKKKNQSMYPFALLGFTAIIVCFAISSNDKQNDFNNNNSGHDRNLEISMTTTPLSCPLGQGPINNVCTACPINTASPYSHNTVCTPCPENSSNYATGMYFCECNKGYHATVATDALPICIADPFPTTTTVAPTTTISPNYFSN